MKDRIQFTVIENNIHKKIETYEGEYRNLMSLLKDKVYPDCFGECGGMGRCATCIVKVEGLLGDLTLRERNEATTLSKFDYDKETFRLSCQIFITKDLNEAVIEMIEL
ncbi:MAG: 2Fe-2S iron-sulfur cluster-binding protein [Niabella sp.]